VKEGTSRLPEGLLHMSEATVKLNSLVTGISRDGSFWNVHVAGADSEQFDMVIVSAPLSRANITFRGLNLWDAVDDRAITVLNQGVCMDEGACMDQGVSIAMSIDPEGDAELM
jgi:protoporphyrinogen oxidase